MADSPRVVKTQKQIADWERTKAQDESVRAEAAQRRRQLWDGINKFVIQQGGWVVSLPGKREIRIEIPQGSSLPSKLFELGYSPHHCGTGTRITGTGAVETIVEHSSGAPIIRYHAGIIPIDILEITLPGK